MKFGSKMGRNRGKSCGCWLLVLSLAVCYTCGVEGDEISSNTAAYHDHTFFIRQIFSKYGDKGIITFEGFEHLLENLGLGRLSFDKKHNVSVHRINGSFQDVHDALKLHDHRHGAKENLDLYLYGTASPEEEAHFVKVDEAFAKAVNFTADIVDQSENSTPTIVKRSAVEDPPEDALVDHDQGFCLSPKALLQTFGLRPNHSVAISPPRFLHLCPAIVWQLDRRTCTVRAAPVLSSVKSPRSNVSRGEAWLHATLATTVISAVGLLAVVMVKLTRRRWFLHFLVALAVGSLSGDALLHLLPHALLSDDVDHETAALRCSATFMAIVFFYGLEAVLMIVRSSRTTKVSSMEKSEASLELKQRPDPARSTCEDEENGSMLGNGSPGHGHSHGVPIGASSSIAFLILVGDGLHNLTDGLAIGASFASDPVAGLATTIAVFCHELPHELGDFAVLINSGMSVKRALLYNLLTSCVSFVGAAAGVWLGEFGNMTQWIYATTAGTFLYIALADLVPEMTAYVKSDAKIQGIFIQLAGIASGGIMMLFIALHEDKLHDLFA